jgi:hypothetical protein
VKKKPIGKQEQNRINKEKVMSNIIALIAGLKGIATLSGVSRETIIDAEKKLGLTFAPDYAEYLEKYALMSAKHIGLTGITESKRLSVIDVTLSAREESQIPQDMYVIEDTAIEGILILQNGKGEIFEFQNNHTKKIYDSLHDYLLSQ